MTNKDDADYEKVEEGAERFERYREIKKESDDAWEDGDYDRYIEKERERRDL